MQDRILGPLTMIQFVYAVVGFGSCYAIFASIPRPLSYIIIAPIALFVVCLDFVKVNERPFLDFFIAALEYSSSPKRRFWSQNTSSNLEVEVYKAVKKTASTEHKNVARSQMQELAQKIDSSGQNTLIRN